MTAENMNRRLTTAVAQDTDAYIEGEEAPIAEEITPMASELDSEEKVRLMASAADAVRAEDIVALDLRELTIIADFFLICTGKSSIQLRAIADRIEERLRDYGLRKLRIEGYQEATWILMDYGDVVAHIMAAEQRAFYNLEAFWSAAPKLPLDLQPDSHRLSETPMHIESMNPPDEAFPAEVEEDTL